MENEIKKRLLPIAERVSFEIFDTISSTNDRAKLCAANGDIAPKVIIAHSQSAGRGRQGRSFFSPDGTGIYMSILLRPKYAPSTATLLTTAAATATAKAIETVCGKTAQIKWINDMFIDGKKVCGILTEAAFSRDGGAIDYAIVGIGINLFAPKNDFPSELREIAGSVFDTEAKSTELKAALCAEIINSLLTYEQKLDQKTYFDEYKRRLFVLGKRIKVISPYEEYYATALDIDSECRLIVKLDDGSVRTLSSGEISTKLI